MKKLLIAILTMVITATAYGLFGGYTEGEKVGTIVKIEKKGLIFKTYEAELIRGGLIDGSGVVGKPFDFTIRSDLLLPVAYQAMQGGHPVDLKYHSEYFAPLSSHNMDKNFADDIMITDLPKPRK